MVSPSKSCVRLITLIYFVLTDIDTLCGKPRQENLSHPASGNACFPHKLLVAET